MRQEYKYQMTPIGTSGSFQINNTAFKSPLYVFIFHAESSVYSLCYCLNFGYLISILWSFQSSVKTKAQE